MEKGIVKWFNTKRGYGFITDATGADIFVHYTGISDPERTLTEGEKVTYDLSENKKGTIAVNVKAVPLNMQAVPAENENVK